MGSLPGKGGNKFELVFYDVSSDVPGLAWSESRQLWPSLSRRVRGAQGCVDLWLLIVHLQVLLELTTVP